MTTSESKPLAVAIVGAGPRSGAYTQYAKRHPEKLRIAAIADPNVQRRNALGDAHSVPAALRMDSYEALAAHRGAVDAAIVATPDIYHYPACMRLLADGFHVLLEKPIAPTEPEVRGIIEAAAKHQRIVMVAHIMRYESFYQVIRRRLFEGAIGKLISIHTVENMGFDHVATTYLRHPRNLSPALMPMMLSKCCHDLDILAWMMGAASLSRVASVLKPTQFRPENAPPGSTDRCLRGCAVEPVCQYSAQALYVNDDTWDGYAWPANEYAVKPPREEKLRILAETSPYGRCAWRCPNPAVDHQSVMMQFDDGVTATHDLFCAMTEAGRTIRVVGTDGELNGDFNTGKLVTQKPDRSRPGQSISTTDYIEIHQRKSQSPRLSDERFMEDFIGTVRGDPSCPGLSRIENSLNGHLIAFAAETSVRERRIVEFT